VLDDVVSEPVVPDPVDEVEDPPVVTGLPPGGSG
jgi:hypothetical protein